MLKQVTYELTGFGKGLMMGNPTLANPLDPMSRKFKDLQAKRGKNRTDEDIREMQKLQFMASMYLNGFGVPGIPDSILIPTIASGNPAGFAKGKEVTKWKLNIRCLEEFYPLIYDGPKDVEELWNDERFSFTRLQEGILKTNAIFPEWKVVVGLEFDTKVFNKSDVTKALEKAGREYYLMAWRSGGWGGFEVKEIK